MCIQRMLAVPLDKSPLLDYLVGRQRGDEHTSEAHVEMHRLQLLLNSRNRNKRFDFTGTSLVARLLQQSIRTQSWDPFREQKVELETAAALDQAVVHDHPEEVLETGRDISILDYLRERGFSDEEIFEHMPLLQNEEPA